MNYKIIFNNSSLENPNEEEKKQSYFKNPGNTQEQYDCYTNFQPKNIEDVFQIKNIFKNNDFSNNKNITQLNNNNSNLYFNILNNNQNHSKSFIKNNKNGNIYNEIHQNNNISINFNPVLNKYQDFNYNIFNCNKIFSKDINNNNDLYINNSVKNNNFSSYTDSYNIQNSINLSKCKINNLNTSYNNFKYINEMNNDKNKMNLDNINNSSNKSNNNDASNINLSNGNQNINNFNSTIQTENIKNNYNNTKNINIITNNFIENKNNNKVSSIINSINKNNLEEFMIYINSLPMPLVNFLCTPKGTLEIQKKLEKSNNEYKIILVNYLHKQGLSKIMKNTYGNYFFQQLIKKNEQSFISLIISYISDDFIDISKDFSGTFSIQALLDEITSFEEEQSILNSIKNSEMDMALNKNATHVLQKIVQLFPDNHRNYLNEVIINNFIELCLDSNGICLIKIFIKTNTQVNNKKRINEKIINNFVTLAESPFGNYGVQYLMEIWNINELKDINEKIMENIYKLSLQQYSSNVVEKAIEILDEENKKKLIKKLCFENNFIIILLKNKFGKFVLNKAIKFMKIDMKKEFENYLINYINNNIYKNKDKSKIKKLLLKLKNNKFNKNEYFNNINRIYNNNFYFNNNINKNNNVVYNNDLDYLLKK